MRKLQGSIIRNIAGRIVRPATLLHIEVSDDRILNFTSNSESVTYNGNIYYSYNYDIKGLSWELKTTTKLTINISNFDYSMSQLALGGLLTDKYVKVHVIYLYDKQNFTTVGTINAAQLNHSLAVTDPIPSDVSKTGELYYQTTDGVINTIAYTDWNGNRFTTDLNYNVPAGIQLHIPKTTYGVNDAVDVFSGYIDEVEVNELTGSLQVLGDAAQNQFSPRRRMTPPTFNHLPPAGTKIMAFGELYTLEEPRY
jgi:hypothetical protein